MIVRVAIEYYGPKIAGVPVHVSGVDLSTSDGRGVVRGLEIGTPAGFDAPRAASVGEIRVVVDPATVRAARGDTSASSPSRRPDITYERGDHGTNLEAIQEQHQALRRRERGESAIRPGGGEARAAQVRGRAARDPRRPRDHDQSGAARPGRHLRPARNPALAEVGKRQGGLTASEIGAIVVGELEAQIARRVLTNIDLLRKGGVGGAIDALKGLSTDAGRRRSPTCCRP